MSIVKKNIAIYSNLPTGGARELYILNNLFLQKKSKVKIVSDQDIVPKNFLDYIRICLFYLPRVHKIIANNISKNSDILVAHHSWLTKSPHVLRYFTKPKIYICQELMREYYDPKHIARQTMKERIINILRLPIKYIDKRNLKVLNLTVIVNSKFSKKVIDKCYQISSILVYPGVDTLLFQQDTNLKKNNQIISVGAINKLKGYEHVIRVISRINRNIRPKLVIVGNGSDQKYVLELRQLALNLEVILDLKINLSKPKLVKEYLKSKLFIYAPINEPFGIVVEEAMAAKLPLAVYKFGGGYMEILTNKNGLIFNSLNLSKWAYEIEKLLRDEKLQEKIGTYNFQYVNSKYTSEIMNRKIWNVIQSL